METVESHDVIYAFSADLSDVARVSPGSRVAFETLDALGGQVTRETDVLSELDFSRVNPATGPVYVEGAKPGDTLVVRILSIELASHGVTVTGPGMGLLGDVARLSTTRVQRVSDGVVYFEDLELPAHPMIGVIGVAPRDGTYPTGTAHRHGGNMDTKEIVAGTTVYLPVEQPGALLAMGDVHAVMGDGEICVSGCEIAARITVEVDLIPGSKAPWPAVKTDEALYLLVSLPTIEEALREAALQGVLCLQRARRSSFESAYMLASLNMDVRVSQLVDPNKTAKAAIPLNLLPGAPETFLG